MGDIVVHMYTNFQPYILSTTVLSDIGMAMVLSIIQYILKTLSKFDLQYVVNFPSNNWGG